MSGDEENPLLITPPPGLLRAASPSPPATDTAPDEPEELITLPPGIADSATHRVATPRISASRAAAADDEIVFFPVIPGGSVLVPVTAPVLVPVTATVAIRAEEALPAVDELADETRLSAPRHSSPPVWRLVLPTGQSVPIATVVIIGRDPIANAAWPGATLVPALDPAKSLSKTHALLEIDAGSLWVHDLASTNGVFVAAHGVDVVKVEPGTRVVVPDGAELEFGEFIVTVLRA